MTVAIEIGRTATGDCAALDLEELLATRLLVQGNSGSGKSHLLRRLLEQSVPWVQQAVIDPEGDFVTLAERFGQIRGQYRHIGYAEADAANELLFQFQFSIGAHGAHPF